MKGREDQSLDLAKSSNMGNPNSACGLHLPGWVVQKLILRGTSAPEMLTGDCKGFMCFDGTPEGP